MDLSKNLLLTNVSYISNLIESVYVNEFQSFSNDKSFIICKCSTPDLQLWIWLQYISNVQNRLTY